MVAPFMCRTCFRSFSTNTHLLRHEKSHLNSQRHGCYFCEQSYPRRDTARRHAKTCSKRHGRSLPPAEKKGQTRKSCDECARNKTSCDRESPCGYCKSNALSCSYSRVLPPPQQAVIATEETPLAPSGDCPDRLLKARIPFLLRYCNVKNTVFDLIPALETGRAKTIDSPNLAARSDQANGLPLEIEEAYLDETHLNESPFMWPSSIELNNHATTHAPHGESTNHQPCETLSQRAQELAHELNKFANSSMSKAHLRNAIDQDLFSAANIRAFEHLYVQHSHRHCPIIHLPTFQAETATLPLLLATLLGGSLHSYPRDTYFLAVDCLDIAEEYLFSLPVFKMGYRHAVPSEPQVSDHYDALKAVVILLQMQIGRNDHEIRQRVRYQRFPRLVHAARLTSLFGARQDADSSASGWRTWDAQLESLRRTAAFILVLDCQFVFCLRSPPMVTIPESTASLPCNELVFSRQQSSSIVKIPHSPSLLDVIDLLMNGAWDGTSNPVLSNIGIFGLFTVIAGLHTVMFAAFAGRMIRQQLAPLDRALSRWKMLWEGLMSRVGKEEVELAGFMTSANEIWLITKAVLHTDAQEYFSQLDCESFQPLNRLFPSVIEMNNQ